MYKERERRERGGVEAETVMAHPGALLSLFGEGERLSPFSKNNSEKERKKEEGS